MKTIKELKKEKEFRKRRKELLIDTIRELIDDEIVTWNELSEILQITKTTLSRLKNNKLPISAEKVEEYLNKILTE